MGSAKLLSKLSVARAPLAGAVLLACSVSPLGSLELTFSPAGPAVSGLASAGSVAWLAVTRESLRDSVRVRVARTVEVISPAATTAALSWDGEVPFHGTFLAVELGTGRVAVGTRDPKGVVLGSGGHVRVDGSGVAIPGQFLQILVIRSGGLVWHGAVADGAAEDLDGATDGLVSFDLATLSALGSAPVGATVAAGDRIWAIDLDTLMLHELVVGGGSP